MPEMGELMKIEYLFEDDTVLVVNKPPGLSTIPERDAAMPSLLKELEKKHEKLFVVHRIDKDTSGVVCFTKTETAHKILNEQFEKHNVRKFYKAIVQGRMMNKEGQVRFPIATHPSKINMMVTHPKGKPSLTLYTVEEEFRHASLLHVEIKTGRTHQVRVHLAAIGNPLLVDAIYGNTNAFSLSSIKKNYKITEEERPLISRLTLHAAELHFYHPVSGEIIICKSALPDDMLLVLKLLRKWDIK
jgi:23S rRNA pseudouridine955/2504/2580 synthase/23S rRNA pseudouridine1911/1915/1917 synthase